MDLIEPMLANSVNPNNLENFITDPSYRFEQKFDGQRLVMHVVDNDPLPCNRRGERQKSTPYSILNAFTSGFDGEWVFDGELLDGIYYIFDLLKAGDFVSIHDNYNQRRMVLEQLFECWNVPDSIRLVASFMEEDEKRRLFEDVLAINGEGIMIKLGVCPKCATGHAGPNGTMVPCRARYVPGKRTDSMLKAKNYKSADVIVSELWRDGKNSVSVVVFSDDGTELINVGAVSMTTANMKTLTVGCVIEVKYLYLGAGNRLYQPAFLRLRPDRTPQSCLFGQLVMVNKEVACQSGQITNSNGLAISLLRQ